MILRSHRIPLANGLVDAYKATTGIEPVFPSDRIWSIPARGAS